MSDHRAGRALVIAATITLCASVLALQAGRKHRTEKPHMSELPTTPVVAPPGREVATFAGGCFWCTEAIFTQLKGVEKVVPGYAGGHVASPSYELVCTGGTGHAEAIQVTFDPAAITYADLVHIFLTVHDPTTLNRQGEDIGTQYRSAIFYHSPTQEKAAREAIAGMDREHIWPAPIVTEVTPFSNFYSAEDYHKDYFSRNGSKPYCAIVIAPKVAKFRAKYQERLKR